MFMQDPEFRTSFPLSNWLEDRSLEQFDIDIDIDIRLNDAQQWNDAEEEHEDRQKHDASVAVESQNNYRTRSINT